MKGQKLRFVLKRAGLKYKDFALMVRKSVVTVQRWVSENEDVGEIYTLQLRDLLTNKIFNKIEQEWDEKQKEKIKRQIEWEEMRRAELARRNLASK